MDGEFFRWMALPALLGLPLADRGRRGAKGECGGALGTEEIGCIVDWVTG
jgi:hypothetical protein